MQHATLTEHSPLTRPSYFRELGGAWNPLAKTAENLEKKILVPIGVLEHHLSSPNCPHFRPSLKIIHKVIHEKL